jgi:hypothetical protein
MLYLKNIRVKEVWEKHKREAEKFCFFFY